VIWPLTATRIFKYIITRKQGIHDCI